MKASELRIGNYHYYTCEDSLDERKKWDEVCQIDSQDLVWLESNPDDEDFKSIPLTEEWLINFGYKKEDSNFRLIGHIIWEYDDGVFICNKNGITFKYVHQLQNLYFAVTGKELLVKEKSE